MTYFSNLFSNVKVRRGEERRKKRERGNQIYTQGSITTFHKSNNN